MPKPIIDAAQAAAMISDGAVIMLGGFMGCGSAHTVIDALARGASGGFTVICNDGAMPGGCLGNDNYGVAVLIHSGKVKKFITSHIGVNPEADAKMKSGEMEIVFVPQGSLAEMMRAGGAGLGGVITPTGVGTDIEHMEHVLGCIELEGRRYLIERPLRADWAVIGCHTADTEGSAWYRGTSRNMNPLMAMAADHVIMEFEHLVPPGGIEPENVATPGIFVDYLVKGDEHPWSGKG